MTTRTRVAALGAAAVLTLTAAACGTDHGSMPMGGAATSSAGSSAGTAAHNDADVAFAQQMIVHHRGAIAMAQLAPDRAGSAQVEALAARIEAAQGPEIEQMTGWLESWGAAAPSSADASAGMGDMDHGDTGHGTGSSSAMPGMMTDAQLQQLTDARGSEFDRLFLELMIAHHEGALEMAQTEKAAGQNPDALALAESITTSQTAEIAEMRSLLQGG